MKHIITILFLAFCMSQSFAEEHDGICKVMINDYNTTVYQCRHIDISPSCHSIVTVNKPSNWEPGSTESRFFNCTRDQ